MATKFGVVILGRGPGGERAAILATGATPTVIAESLYNYPTLSELFRLAAMDAPGQKMRRDQGGGTLE